MLQQVGKRRDLEFALCTSALSEKTRLIKHFESTFVAFEGTGSSDKLLCLLCCETRQIQLADNTTSTCLLNIFSVHVFLVSHPYRRNLHIPHVDVQLYFLKNIFGLIYGSRLGQALGRVFSSAKWVRSCSAAL